MNRVVINSVEESRNFLEPVVWKRDRANGNKQANRRSYEVRDVRGRKSNVGGWLSTQRADAACLIKQNRMGHEAEKYVDG